MSALDDLNSVKQDPGTSQAAATAPAPSGSSSGSALDDLHSMQANPGGDTAPSAKQPGWVDTANKYYNDIIPGESMSGRVGKALGRTAMMAPNMAVGAYHAFTDAPTAEENKLAINSPTTGRETLIGRTALAGKRMLLDPSVAAGQHVDDMARAQEARAAATGVPIAHPTRAKIAEGLGKVEASIPMVGPWALSEGERAGKGDIAGAMTDVAAMGALPEVAKEAMPGGELSTQPEGAPAFPVASKLIPSAETAGKVAAAPIRGLGKVYNAAVDNPTLAGAAGGALIGGPFGGIVGGLEGAVGGGILGRGLKLLPRASDSITELGIPEHEVAVNHLTDTFKAAQKDHALAARAKADYAASEREGVQIPDSVQKKFDTTKAKMDEAEYHLDAAKQHSAAIKAGFGSVDDQLQHNVTQENYKAADAASNGAKAAPDALINVPKAPQGPLGSVQASTEGPTWRVGEQPAAAERPAVAQPAAEVPVAPKAQTTAEGVPPVAPKTTSAMEDLIPEAPKAAVPPTATEAGLVGAEYKEAGGPGPEELHPVVKEQVSLLRNAKLKALGKAYGLNPEEYDFSDRQRLTPSGSKHAVQREQFVNDVMDQMSPEEIQSIGRQAGDLEHNPDMAGKHKAERAESLFPKLRKATPVDEFGNPTVSGGSQGATEESVGEGLGNSGNSPPSRMEKIEAARQARTSKQNVNPLADYKVELTRAEKAEATRLGQDPETFDRLRRGMTEEEYGEEFGNDGTGGRGEYKLPRDYPLGDLKWNDPVAIKARADANAAEGLPARRRASGYGQTTELGSEREHSTTGRYTPEGGEPTTRAYGSPSQEMPKIPSGYRADAGRQGIDPSTASWPKIDKNSTSASQPHPGRPLMPRGQGTEARPTWFGKVESKGESTGKAGYGDFTKTSPGAIAPLGDADKAVIKYAQTRPALGTIERAEGHPEPAQSDQLIPNKREGGPAQTYDTKTGTWSKRAEGYPKVERYTNFGAAPGERGPEDPIAVRGAGKMTGNKFEAWPGYDEAKEANEKKTAARDAAEEAQHDTFVSRMEEINARTQQAHDEEAAKSEAKATEPAKVYREGQEAPKRLAAARQEVEDAERDLRAASSRFLDSKSPRFGEAKVVSPLRPARSLEVSTAEARLRLAKAKLAEELKGL
jgi:hypothetical protein